ncbi:MAG: hypothetical protein FD169_1483 [Bacillota bacterium]|nr:MAG: hypothetical protein FD169_1483 [Bacillota bacterium]MBS3950189.1 hypothetical protein [Peptococcaceae bacterium]
MTKRNVSIVLVLIVAVAAWVLAHPSTGDIKTAKPFAVYEAARAQQKPIFIMFTSDG